MAGEANAAGAPGLAGIRERTVRSNGMDLHVFEAGDPADPMVILSHGFPETAYSWRHQLPALAAAGYYVVAPDQRGYGYSTVPPAIEDYGIEDLVDDLVGLIDEAGHDDAVFIGHDWGSYIVWDAARLRPDRVRGVVSLSVPAVQWGDRPPAQAIREKYGDAFHYVLHFEKIGAAEAELEADPEATTRRFFWAVSAEGGILPIASTGPQDGFLDSMPDNAPPLPWRWLTQADLDYYTAQFSRSGYFGAVSYYRNIDHDFDVLQGIGWDRVTMPSSLMVGTTDPVVVQDTEGMFVGLGRRSEQMARTAEILPDYRGTVMIDGAGHWLQQEQPERVNEALLAFLQEVDGLQGIDGPA